MVDFPFANGYAKRLIELGADINKPDINGHVALHYCITSKNYEMFNYLCPIPISIFRLSLLCLDML